MIYFFGIMVVAGLVLSTQVWHSDPSAMLRYTNRMMIVIPLAVLLSIASIRMLDKFTPNEWMDRISNDEMACAIVVGSFILGVFWLCVQG